MKIMSDKLLTSTELMQEFFDMNEKLIHNLSEKERYEKIYEYLKRKTSARQIARRKDAHNTYMVFSWHGEIYLIPENIFDANDEGWAEFLDKKVETQKENPRAVVGN